MSRGNIVVPKFRVHPNLIKSPCVGSVGSGITCRFWDNTRILLVHIVLGKVSVSLVEQVAGIIGFFYYPYKVVAPLGFS
jgi:hypothetical protein